ncbi:MAG TPA: hypothetical protein VKK06_12825 [Terriglobia bacterium]|nr:hypothetical protein [Terriglobia bacterium]
MTKPLLEAPQALTPDRSANLQAALWALAAASRHCPQQSKAAAAP